MIQEDRVFVAVDGSNFYHRLKETQKIYQLHKVKLLDFQYNSFVDWLAGSRVIVDKKYYVGVVRAKPDNIKG